MIKIAHLADIHIYPNMRHDEYRRYFDFLYQKLHELKVDAIFLGGDIFHSKTNTTPDFYKLGFEFFRGLSAIAPIILIPGNHDLAERNLNKLDALSPIVDNLKKQTKHPIHYLKESKDYDFCLYDHISIQKVIFRSFSLMDKENWKFDEVDKNVISIALYHGGVKGSETDLGFIFEDGIDLDNFKEFDYVLMGDVHKQQMFRNIKAGYSGSPWQMQFGDQTGKGFIVWNIEDKDKYKCEYIEIPNYYPYITLNQKNELPDLSDMIAGRFKIEYEQNDLELSVFLQSIKEKYKGKIKSLDLFKKLRTNSFSKDKEKKEISFNEYIKENKNSNKLINIHEQYLEKIKYKKLESFNWKINSVKWNNFFSYGEDNEINFKEFQNKSIGLFGEGFSGKTSAIKVICFSLFGEIPKPFVKSVNLIHDNKSYASCETSFSIGDNEYLVERKLERKKNGDAKSILNFYQIINNERKNLNADDVKLTQAEICKLIGTFDDFNTTSLSTQFNNFTLLDEKNTKRKEYFFKFLGISQYEEIFLILKKDIQKLEIELEAIKNYENVIEKYKEIQKTIQEKNEQYAELLVVYDIQRENWKNINNIFLSLEEQYQLFLKKENSIESTNKAIKNCKDLINKFQLIVENKNQDLIGLSWSDEYLNILNLNLKSNKEVNLNLNEELYKIKNKLKQIEKSEELLKNIPCSNQFPTCQFLIDANKQKDEKNQTIEYYNKIISNLDYNKIILNDFEDKIKKEKEKEILYNKQKTSLELIEHNKELIKTLNKSLEDNEWLLEKEINELSILKVNRDEYFKQKIEIEELRTQRDSTHSKLMGVFNEVEQYKKLSKELEDKIRKIFSLEESLLLLKEYSEIVGKNGITLDILNEFIPNINDLINNILVNIVNFRCEIRIDLDDKTLDIFLLDNISERLIECCSGSQKSLIALSLRMALLQYSQISSSDVFILDEPGTSLSETMLSDFPKILETMKEHGKTVLLVTHIPKLKEYVDKELNVDISCGYSKIIS